MLSQALPVKKVNKGQLAQWGLLDLKGPKVNQVEGFNMSAGDALHVLDTPFWCTVVSMGLICHYAKNARWIWACR